MIPASSAEFEDYTPPSLENVEPKPVFRFRPATWADRRRYNQALLAEGLRLWSDEAVRNETRKALKDLWSEEQHASEIGRLESFWAAVDYAAKHDDGQIDQKEAEAAAELMLAVVDNWPPLRRMNADNLRFNEMAPLVALSLFLAGWSNVDAALRRAAGQIDFESLDKLAEAVLAIETRALAEKIEGVSPGTGFLQLATRAIRHLGFDKDEEKNSPAPSSTSSIQNGSKDKANGASVNSSSRRGKTRARSSAKTTATS
jgi:hypothetical protein